MFRLGSDIRILIWHTNSRLRPPRNYCLRFCLDWISQFVARMWGKCKDKEIIFMTEYSACIQILEPTFSQVGDQTLSPQGGISGPCGSGWRRKVSENCLCDHNPWIPPPRKVIQGESLPYTTTSRIQEWSLFCTSRCHRLHFEIFCSCFLVAQAPKWVQKRPLAQGGGTIKNQMSDHATQVPKHKQSSQARSVL